MEIIIIGAIVVVLIIPIIIYNSLVGKRNQVKNTFASTDTLLKKRFNLIPNLVSTVKQYMTHEQKTLTDITEMRAKAVSGNLSSDQKVDIENKMTKALGGIMVAVENYPDLKANQNFIQLQKSLNEIEEQISAARRAYNAAVTTLNDAIQMFPSNIIASMGNFKQAKLFEISVEERKNVNVANLFNS